MACPVCGHQDHASIGERLECAEYRVADLRAQLAAVTKERDEAKEWNAGQIERFARERRFHNVELEQVKAKLAEVSSWLLKDDHAMLATLAAEREAREKAERYREIVTETAAACGDYPGLGQQVRDLLLRSLDDADAEVRAALAEGEEKRDQTGAPHPSNDGVEKP